MVHQIKWCELVLLAKTGNFSVFPIISLVINGAFLIFLLISLRHHLSQFKLLATKIIPIYYFFLYLIVCLDIVVSVLTGLNYKHSRLIPVISSIGSVLIFFCETSLLIFMLLGNTLRYRVAMKNTITFSVIISFCYLVIHLVLLIKGINLYDFRLDNSTTLYYWLAVDSLFSLIYFLLLIMTNLKKFKYRLPMKSSFFGYVFFMFSTKLFYLTGYIFLINRTLCGYCFIAIGMLGNNSLFCLVFYLLFLREYFRFKNVDYVTLLGEYLLQEK
ncbi:transmembrane protein adipocyte-associated 1 [Anaeramoeba flamelloides]|uniref:Transmembrane protein adipocyte-associated n=1 Tax=Anaeramoeba flamelloides TaxID=1746091 RepID=A0AAV7Z2L5_9EUKA|nr:transmembrane protein adipocyte-associated [Anaeramoeba flamelloides]KAJ6244844.1 transmembrane protein adipocyte-associated 1 [Anaeramoeba flamelloides]